MVMKNRIRYLAVLLAVTLFFTFYSGYISLYAMVVTLFLPLLSLVLSIPAAAGMTLSLSVEGDHVTKGREVPLEISLTNRRRMVSGRVRLVLTVRNALTGEKQEETFVLTAYPGTQTILHTLTPTACGRVTCEIARGAVLDHLGVFALPLKKLRARSVVMVYPGLHDAAISQQQTAVQDGEWAVHSQTKPGDDPSELFGFREYREGDRLSRIHWKLSQKTDQTLVKEYGLPVTDDLAILVELNGSGEAMDALMETFATISSYLAERESAHQVGFWDGTGQGLTLLQVTRPDSLMEALRALLSVEKKGFVPAHAVEDLPQVSHVIYLTARPWVETMGNLRAFLPSARISVLRVEDGDSAGVRLPENAALYPIDPRDISRSLNGFPV